MKITDKEKQILLLALSYAQNWTESLIDANVVHGKTVNKHFTNRCAKENKQFAKLKIKIFGSREGTTSGNK